MNFYQDIPLRLAGSSSLHFNNPLQWKWISNTRPHYNLWILLSGTACMCVDGENHLIEPGFSILLDPDQKVSAESRGEVPVCNIGLHFYLDGDPGEEISALIGVASRLRHLPLIVELTRYLEEGAKSKFALDSEEQKMVLLQILRILSRDRATGTEDPLDRNIREQSQSILLEPGNHWLITDLARNLSLSLSQYERRFRRVMGDNPLAFIIRCRMDSACSLLLNSSLRIGEIAENLGYRDIAYFSRQFQQRTGVSPLEYRKKAINEKL